MSSSRLSLVETWEDLDLISDWKSNVSVSSRSRAIGSCLQANMHSFCFIAKWYVHHFECKASILFTDSQAVVSFTSLLHTFAIAMQYTIQKVLFLDFANAKSLTTSSKSTERSMSASVQSRDRESNLSWPIVVLYGFLILLSTVCKHWWWVLLSTLHRFATQQYDFLIFL